MAQPPDTRRFCLAPTPASNKTDLSQQTPGHKEGLGAQTAIHAHALWSLPTWLDHGQEHVNALAAHAIHLLGDDLSLIHI